MIPGRFLVMRYGTLIGRLDGRKIVSVAARRFTLDGALSWAKGMTGGSFWIIEKGKPAHRTAARS